MSDEAPVVLEVALNGVTQPEQNATVPREPAEIAEQALSCIAAGASVIHTHTHDPVRSAEETNRVAPVRRG
jgi:3-keto-5-aminohexanoate cleavage enzyme